MRKPLTPPNRKQAVIRPDAARNARPKKVSIITHGGRSESLLHDSLDQRTRVGKAYTAYKLALVQHLGGNSEVSVPQRLLVDQAARLQLLVGLAWHELNRVRPFRRDGSIAPAFDALIRAQRELRSILESLGLKRRTKELTLSDYLAGKGEGDRVFGSDDDDNP